MKEGILACITGLLFIAMMIGINVNNPITDKILPIKVVVLAPGLFNCVL